MPISNLLEETETLDELFGIGESEPKLTLKKLQKLAPSIAQLELRNPEHPAVEYVNSRKLTPDAKKFIFYTDHIKDWAMANLSSYTTVPNIPTNEAFIMMPYADKKGVVSILKCRNLNPNAKFRYIELIIKSDTPKIYNLDKLNPKKLIYVLEGEIDASFIPNSIAMAGGGDITKNLNSLPYPKQQYVIVYDNELDKKSTVTKIVEAITKHFKVCIWPTSVAEFKDVNDMIKGGLTSAQIIKIINDNTFAGGPAIDVLKERGVPININTDDIWTQVYEAELRETINVKDQATKPLPWADKFLTNLFPLKSKLNPKFWDKDDQLQPRIQRVMLSWADKFIKSMRIAPTRVRDIQFKGSLANYVYHKSSDIDIHIIVDKKPTNPEMNSILEKQRKSFNDLNGYTIFGFPVEFFIKVEGEIHSSDAVYSIRNAAWVRKPNPPKDKNIDEIKKFFVLWYNSIREAYNITWTRTKSKKDAWKAANFELQKIQDIRNKVLDGSPGAEYKPENLAFKALKRTKFFAFLDTEKRKFEQEQRTVK